MRVSRPPWRFLEDETDTGSRPGIRKKGLGARAWLAVDPAGNGRVVELSRQAVMRLTGLPARDLRILDPQLSYPSTVLGRERAIVVGLEHIKAIITAHEVLLMNHNDPAVDPFVRELLRRVIRHRELRRHHERGEFGSSDIWSNEYDLERSKSMNETEAPLEDHHGDGIENEKGKGEEIPSDDTRALPFEFIALEACFEAACSCLENEATLLENEAHPALDKLTSKISTLNLERVRQIKSQLVAITGRVQKVRDELEHLLDDDGDMAEMYLTDKILQQHLSDEFSHYSRSDPGNVMEEGRVHAETSLEESDPSDNSEGCSQNAVIHNHSLSGPTLLNEENHGSHTCSTRSSSKHLDVQDLEMLLEAYFVQIDSTLNKLSTLREYVDDTEDYINIMLDDKQNQLLQMGVMLTTATLVISGFVTLVSIFGMNIQIDLFDEKKAGMPEFLWTVGGSATGSIILYVIAIAWCKRRRLIE